MQRDDKLVTAEERERARREGASDLEIHDTVLIAAACLVMLFVLSSSDPAAIMSLHSFTSSEAKRVIVMLALSTLLGFYVDPLTGAIGATAPGDLKIADEDKFLSSSHESWASGDPNALTTGITEYKAGRDIKGPIPVASEIDFTPASNPHIPLQQMTRLVGIGSSAFASNQFVEMLGNRDLAVSLINELAGDEMLIASRERLNKSETAAFYISDQEARHVLVLGSVVEPAILFLIAITVMVRRRFFA